METTLTTIGHRPVLKFKDKSMPFRDWQQAVGYINRTGVNVELPPEMPDFFKQQITVTPLLHEAHAFQLVGTLS